MILLIMAICTVAWKALYYCKIKIGQEARHDQFSFKMFKIMRPLRSSKCLKTTVELTVTIQKSNAFSPWTACSVFNWKHVFWVNLVERLKIISISWNFVTRLVQICRIQWWCSLFLLSIGNTFLGNFDLKNKICHLELKFCTRLIWICKIM